MDQISTLPHMRECALRGAWSPNDDSGNAMSAQPKKESWKQEGY